MTNKEKYIKIRQSLDFIRTEIRHIEEEASFDGELWAQVEEARNKVNIALGTAANMAALTKGE